MVAIQRIIGLSGAVILAATTAVAQGGGHQCPHRGGAAAAPAPGRTAASDMQVFHYLLANRQKIRRTVDQLPNGILTLTESDDPAVVEQLQAHVNAMVARMEDNRPIHARDPLFAELFRQAEHVKVQIERLPSGVRVTETSEDLYTVKLLREHARVVSLFLERGMSEMHRDHAVPPR